MMMVEYTNLIFFSFTKWTEHKYNNTLYRKRFDKINKTYNMLVKFGRKILLTEK